MSIYMIATLGDKTNTVGLRLYDANTKEVKDVPYKNVLAMYQNREDEKNIIENIELSPEGTKLVGNNGIFSRYTLIKLDRVTVIGKAPLVVLQRMLNGDYTVIDYKGVVARMTKEQAIEYAKTEGIANGKLVSGEDGYYISSISGEYDQEIPVDGEAVAKKVNAVNALMGINKYKLDENGHFYLVDKSIAGVLIIPAGTVGIKDYGCSNCLGITEVVLPEGLEYLGIGAFKNCMGLQTVYWKEPSKVETIQFDTFKGCVEMKKIDIAGSVRNIESGAFLGCKKLKLVTTGPARIEMKLGAIPRNAVIRKR